MVGHEILDLGIMVRVHARQFLLTASIRMLSVKIKMSMDSAPKIAMPSKKQGILRGNH